MAELRSKEELLDELTSVFESFKTLTVKENKSIVSKIKQGLKKYKILPGEVQEIINNPEEKLQLIDIDKLCLISEESFLVTKKGNIDPTLYFTKREIKEIKTNFEGYSSDTIEFPYTFEDVTKVDDDDYFLKIQGIDIKKIYHLLQYNPDTQREARQIKKGDEIVPVPKIYQKNVDEMIELIKKGEIIASMLTLNARLGSSDEGEELVYDEAKRTLTVTRGTLLDVLDGFHRISAINSALRQEPTLNPTFKMTILNYDKTRAQKYFAQMNTFSVISTSHLKKMSESRQADFIAKQLQYNTELRNKVAASDMVPAKSNLLVTFGVLSDAIDDVFKVEDKPTAIKVSRYLGEFINKLFFAFPDEFMGDIAKIREQSLINANSMFYGYILLAKRMQEENISVDNVEKVLKDIDFSRTNSLWRKIKLIDKNNNITTKPKNTIYKFFNELKLDKYKVGAENETTV
ncbi:DNA sulfur modification protein DndB [Bacillus sp. S13(2024)]|uniref:DNA sulfur modification protein DndB n=1 Tax=Bacillus sp. S13(2024) TaxID=3162885 RepID=UPI003D1F5554